MCLAARKHVVGEYNRKAHPDGFGGGEGGGVGVGGSGPGLGGGGNGGGSGSGVGIGGVAFSTARLIFHGALKLACASCSGSMFVPSAVNLRGTQTMKS